MAEGFVRWLDECDVSSTADVGGKCAGLGELLAADLPVPPGFAITTRAHRAFLAENRLTEHISRALASLDPDDVASLEQAAEAVRELTAAAVFPAAVAEAVRDTYAELARRCGQEGVPVAVRSSAVAEDLATASFAGQLETYLWVRGPEEVLRHTRRCWASFYSASALGYRQKLGLADAEAHMGVGVQKVVDARAAGVLFTLNPTNGDRSKVVIEASWGLGEAIVRGEVDPDRYVVDKVTLDVIERTISGKEMEHRFDPAAGKVVAVGIEDERRSHACLTDDEVIELVRIGTRIERHYGCPQDVEWAVDGSGAGALYVLQSRPETVWSRRPVAPIAGPGRSALDYVVSGLVGRATGERRERSPK
jgi:pyruvate,water dikinase